MLPQALLADQTDNTTGPGRPDAAESQPRWEFAYGERAVLYGGKKAQEATGEDGDEGDEESSDHEGGSEAASSQDEGEGQGEDGQTQVKVNQLSRWRVDGKMQGLVAAREEQLYTGEEAEDIKQTTEEKRDSDSLDTIPQNRSDDQVEDVVGSLSVDDSFQSNVSSLPHERGAQSRLEQSSEKEDQTGLRDREAAEDQECFLCGEWGHGMHALNVSKAC